MFVFVFISREIGTIVRSLNCCLTEGELHDILKDVSAISCQLMVQIWLINAVVTNLPKPSRGGEVKLSKVEG